jgi:hypothetical protein
LIGGANGQPYPEKDHDEENNKTTPTDLVDPFVSYGHHYFHAISFRAI